MAIPALVALRSLTPDAREVFEGHLKRVRERPTTPRGDGMLPARRPDGQDSVNASPTMPAVRVLPSSGSMRTKEPVRRDAA